MATTEPQADAIRELIDNAICEVAELPDRTSPDEWPEAMLVTADELRGILLQFAEAVAARTRPQWQPIATAPKDGTRVLLTWRGLVTVGYCTNPDGDWWDSEIGTAFPTHWMPLPDPPVADPQEAVRHE